MAEMFVSLLRQTVGIATKGGKGAWDCHMNSGGGGQASCEPSLHIINQRFKNLALCPQNSEVAITSNALIKMALSAI